MARTAKLTVSLPPGLIALADQLAKEKKVSRSQIVSSCLQELAERRRVAEMVAGYKAVAEAQKEFVNLTSPVAHEVVPEWE